MAVEFEIDVPNASRLADRLRRDGNILADATAREVRRATGIVKRTLREQLVYARLAPALTKGLAGAVRSAVDPKSGASLNATGRVWSRATVKRAGGPIDLLRVWAEGATIRARAGHWLAIPLPNAPKKGRRRMSPSEFPASALFVRITSGRGVIGFRADDEPRWALVRRTSLSPRIDPDGAFAAGTRLLESRIARTFDRLAKKAGLEGAA